MQKLKLIVGNRFIKIGLAFLLAIAAQVTMADPNFKDNKNGTLTDKRTGLTWIRCAVNQRWTGKTCVGDKVYYLAQDALKMQIRFAGRSDWRMPTIDELWSSLPYGGGLFLNQPFSWVYWSSSPSYDEITQLYFLKTLQFNTNSRESMRLWKGFDVNSPWFSDTRAAIRLVRGKSKWDYIDNKNGTVTDGKTKLTWQRCLVGQVWKGETCVGKPRAFTYKQAHAGLKFPGRYAGQTGWRLPTKNEMATLVGEESAYPIRDFNVYNTYFPNTHPNWYYWTSRIYSVTPYWWDTEITGFLISHNQFSGWGYPDVFNHSTSYNFENRFVRLVNPTYKRKKS